MTANEYQRLAMKTLNPELSRKDVLINSVMGLVAKGSQASAAPQAAESETGKEE